jgi:hypothetical protein
VPDLVIITPTRGRPDRFAGLVDAVRATCALDVQVWAGIDNDDPADYGQACGADLVVAFRGARRSLSGWTNHLARIAVESDNPPRYLASLGDDHRPRTPHWDRKLAAAIEAMPGPGIAYGDDLLQRAQLPTAWMVSVEAVQAVGWMMLPTCEHMYVDNAVLELGRAAGRIAYRPDAVIEHLHPVAGKTAWDESYRETNHAARFAADREAFLAWKQTGMVADVAKLLRRTRTPEKSPS